MKGNWQKKTLILGIGLALIAPSWAAKTNKRTLSTDKGGVPLQAPETVADEAAYSYQVKAIVGLVRLIQRKKNSPAEPQMLFRLADLQQQKANTLFRIAHGEAFHAKKSINLMEYEKAMRDSVFSLNRLIKKYPKFPQLPLAYLMRAKAHEETGNRMAATQDYLFIVGNVKDLEYTNEAYQALAEYAIEASDYSSAIGYLHELEKNKPSSNYYGYALHKLAWTYNQVEKVNEAMSYVSKYIGHQNIIIQNPKTPFSSKRANRILRDDLLVSSTQYYVKGFEKGMVQYTVDGALGYFRNMAKGPQIDEAYAKMLLRFAKVLKAHNHHQALVRWKSIILAEENRRSQSVEIVLLAMESQLSKYQYQELLTSSRDLVALYKKRSKDYSFEIAENRLMDIAKQIQQWVEKNSKQKNVTSAHWSLAMIYNTFLKISRKTDPRVVKAHYNLAEAFMGIKKPEKAVGHYEWVFVYGPKFKKKYPKQLGDLDIYQAGLSGVALRYQSFLKRKIVPKSLKPVNIADVEKPDVQKKIPRDVIRWTKHLSRLEKIAPPEKRYEELDKFKFEEARMIYAFHHVTEAISRLEQFLKDYDRSPLTDAAATLVLDTYLASYRWKDAHDTAVRYADMTIWSKKEFTASLGRVAADSFYKLSETLFNDKKFDQVIAFQELFERRYKDSHRKEDWLNLAGRSALALKDYDRSDQLFNNLVQNSPKSKYVGEALIMLSSAYESRFLFTRASDTVFRYLKQTEAQKGEAPEVKGVNRNALSEKAMLFAWIDGDYPRLKRLLEDKEICHGGLGPVCLEYRALFLLEQSFKGSPDLYAKEIDTGIQKSGNKGPSSSLWRLLALQNLVQPNSRDLASPNKRGTIKQVNEYIRLFREFITGYPRMNDLARVSTLPTVTLTINNSYHRLRSILRESLPLSADEESIARRLNWIQKIEESAAGFMDTPWVRLQASVLSQVANFYQDMALDLQALPPPDGMDPEQMAIYRKAMAEVAQPFTDSSREIRATAFQLASENAVAEDVFYPIAAEYFKDNPSEAVTMPDGFGDLGPGAISIHTLGQMDPRGGWDSLSATTDDEGIRLRSLWHQAMEKRLFAKASFLVQIAETKELGSPVTRNAMKAVSLAMVGARAEAIVQLESGLKMIQERDHRAAVISMLIKNYIKTVSKKRLTQIMKTVAQEQITDLGLTQEEKVIASNLTGMGFQ